METIATAMANKLLDFGILGIVTLALAYLYFWAMRKIETLNAQLHEQTKIVTKALTENTLVMQASVEAQEKGAEASRMLTQVIQLDLSRRG